MTHITEHYSEKEGESDSSKDGRIHFLVSWDSISISNFLSDDGIAVGIESSGGFSDWNLLELRCRLYDADSGL